MIELTRYKKLENLRDILRDMGEIAVAFSGGVDSTFLVCYAQAVLGAEKVTAVTAVAPNFADDEIRYAKDLAISLGIRHLISMVELPELFWKNPKDRCYHCKKSIFTQLINETVRVAESSDAHPGHIILCDGQNKDDESDYRPGSIAAKELGVRSPLHEAGLTKSEIRESLREMGVEIWNKPAFACLASRIPYDTEITEAKLNAIYDIELKLRENGLTQVRARLHDPVIRLELLPEEFSTVLDNPKLKDALIAIANTHGYSYVTLDIQGYKMGNLNSAII